MNRRLTPFAIVLVGALVLSLFRSEDSPSTSPRPGLVLAVSLDPNGLDATGPLSGGKIEVFDAGAAGETPWVREGAITSYGSFCNPLASVRFEDASSARDLCFSVPQGRQFLVRATGEGFRTELALATFRPGAARAELVLDLLRNDKSGTIEIELTAEGEPVERGSSVTLTIDRGGLGLPSWVGRGRTSVVPGTYRVAAFGLSVSDYEWPVMEAAWGRVSELVTVREGEVVPVALDLQRGGWLEITVQGALTDADVRAQEQEAKRLVRQWQRRDLAGLPQLRAFIAKTPELRFDMAKLSLVNAREHHVMPVQRGIMENIAITEVIVDENGEEHLIEGEPCFELSDLSDHWPFGETHRSQMLPTGHFQLRAQVPGRAEVVTRVTITAGETTALTLNFDG